MTHVPVKLKRSSGSFGLLTRNAPEATVIFVHGFGGHPRGTWSDFEHLIDDLAGKYPAWSACDLLFYGYGSYKQFPVLAQEFLDFLDIVAVGNVTTLFDVTLQLPSANDLPSPFLASLWKSREKPSRRLFLVGHSTGGVIIREAIRLKLQPIFQQEPDLAHYFAKDTQPGTLEYATHLIANASLRLFAPANLGVIAAGQLALVRSIPVIDYFVEQYLRFSPLYQNLSPGNPLLATLKTDTEQLYKKHSADALKAATLFGEYEDIVSVGSYAHDEQLRPERRHNHTSICKPNRSYEKPLEFVISVPNRRASA